MNKASGGDGIPVELFQILKDDAVKCCTQYASKFGKKQWSQDWKRSVFSPIPKKGNAKEYSNYHTIALIPHTSKVMLKILQARFQQYVNHELPDVQTSLVDETVKSVSTTWETQVQSLGGEDLLEKERATHFSFLAQKIPQMEEPCWLQPMGSQRVGYD